jgi:hypothetical protein
MSGAVVSVLLWSVVVAGYACSVWSLGKVWREETPRGRCATDRPEIGEQSQAGA